MAEPPRTFDSLDQALEDARKGARDPGEFIYFQLGKWTGVRGQRMFVSNIKNNRITFVDEGQELTVREKRILEDSKGKPPKCLRLLSRSARLKDIEDKKSQDKKIKEKERRLLRGVDKTSGGEPREIVVSCTAAWGGRKRKSKGR